MPEELVTLPAADGDCPVHVFTPDEPGAHPGVILYMDALGIRPAILDMGRRLASNGYVVLVPDLFYRLGDYGPLDPKEVFGPPGHPELFARMLSATDTHRAAEDSRAFIDYLASRPDVAGDRFGTTGYCMGGRISLTVGGTFPERIGAVASFHASQVVTGSELSPSRVVPDIAGRVLVVGADHDAGYTPENAAELERLLTEAGIEHTLEVYPDALHGFTMTDFPVYNEAAAERHWRELLDLLDSTLRVGA